MRELPDRFKDAVGDVPAFDPAALVARVRRHRRRQLGASTASAALVITLVVAVFGIHRSDSRDDVALHTRDSASSSLAMSTTAAPRPTVATTTATTARATSQTPTTTTTPTSTLPTVAASANPGVDDFTGSLTVDRTTVRVGETVAVHWSIRNITDHPIIPFYLGVFAWQNPEPPTKNDVAAICVPLTPDGQPAIRLTMETDRNLFLPPYNTYVQPGASLESQSRYTVTTDDVGAVTCEVVVIDLTSGGGYTDVRVLARVAAIPPMTITVSPDDTATTTSTTTSSTTTPATTTTT